MLSHKSVSIMIKIVSLANRVGIMPVKWDKARNQFISVRTWRHRLIVSALILQCCFTVVFSQRNYTVKSDTDLVIVVFLVFLLGGGLYLLFWMNWYRAEVVEVLNGLITFDSAQVKILQLQKVNEDVLSKVLEMFWRLLQVLCLTIPFHLCIFVQTETSVGAAWKLDSILLTLLGILGVTFFFELEIVGFLVIAAFHMFYVTAISNWMKKLSRNICEFKRNKQIKIIQRAHAVLHTIMFEFEDRCSPLLGSLAYVIVITCYFTAFRTENIVFGTIVFVIGSTVCAIIHVVFTLLYYITRDSEVFLDGFIEGQRTVENRQFVKSCRPLYSGIGPYNRFSSNTVPAAMHEIVINAIISLLLAFPN